VHQLAELHWDPVIGTPVGNQAAAATVAVAAAECEDGVAAAYCIQVA
jgi:hypothetical protein